MRKLTLLFAFIIFVLFSPVIWPVKAEQADNIVRFVQISDVHLHNKGRNRSGRMLGHSPALLNTAINQVNRQVNQINGLDFVVFTGDMIDIPSPALLKSFADTANKLAIPWFWTTGNHDVDGRFNKQVFLDTINENNHNVQANTYYSFKRGIFLFIFMDGAIDDRITSNAYFPKQELAWLDGQIKANPDYYVVIFQHYPVFEPFPSKSHKILNEEEYFDVIDKYDNVIAVITGHYHTARVKLRNNVAHISSPSLVQYPNAFRVITLKAEKGQVLINLEFVPSALSEIREASKEDTRASTLHDGRKKDRDRLIILDKPLINLNRQLKFW